MKRLNICDIYLELYLILSGKEVQDVDEIPSSAMFFFTSLEYNHLVRPLIHRDLMQKKITPGMAAKKYGVSKSFCYRMGIKLGLYR